jgi:hypothetical protein
VDQQEGGDEEPGAGVPDRVVRVTTNIFSCGSVGGSGSWCSRQTNQRPSFGHGAGVDVAGVANPGMLHPGLDGDDDDQRY